MIASRLASLEKSSQEVDPCRVVRIIESLGKQEGEALKRALANPNLSVRSILAILRDEKVPASNESLRQGRKCLMDAGNCRCGLKIEVKK